MGIENFIEVAEVMAGTGEFSGLFIFKVGQGSRGKVAGKRNLSCCGVLDVHWSDDGGFLGLLLRSVGMFRVQFFFFVIFYGLVGNLCFFR